MADDDGPIHTWTSLWAQYIAVARDMAHEALTRREGLASAAATASRARFRSASHNLAVRFGDVDALVAPLAELERTYLALLGAFRTPATAETDDVVTEFTAASDLLADALAEYARIHRFGAEYARSASIRRIVTLPFAAQTLASVTAYADQEYVDSSLAHETLVQHVCTVLAPLFDMFLEPADDMDLRLEALLRRPDAL